MGEGWGEGAVAGTYIRNMKPLLIAIALTLSPLSPAQRPLKPTKAAKYSFPKERDAAVIAVTRTVLGQVYGGKVDSALIAPPLRPQFAPGKVKTLRAQLKEFGPLKAVKLVDRKPGDAKDVATMKITLGDTVFIGTMTVTAGNRLETFLLLEE